jgi:hypothetical protein
MISASSITNEYYCGDLPGNLQYKKDPQELMALQLPDNSDERGFKLCEHSAENLRRITPHTRCNVDWKILLMMKKVDRLFIIVMIVYHNGKLIIH